MKYSLYKNRYTLNLDILDSDVISCILGDLTTNLYDSGEYRFVLSILHLSSVLYVDDPLSPPNSISDRHELYRCLMSCLGTVDAIQQYDLSLAGIPADRILILTSYDNNDLHVINKINDNARYSQLSLLFGMNALTVTDDDIEYSLRELDQLQEWITLELYIIRRNREIEEETRREAELKIKQETENLIKEIERERLEKLRLQQLITDTEVTKLVIAATDIYTMMSLDRYSSGAKVKKGYKKLAFKIHPDRSKSLDSTKAFQKLSNEYTKYTESPVEYDNALREIEYKAKVKSSFTSNADRDTRTTSEKASYYDKHASWSETKTDKSSYYAGAGNNRAGNGTYNYSSWSDDYDKAKNNARNKYNPNHNKNSNNSEEKKTTFKPKSDNSEPNNNNSQPKSNRSGKQSFRPKNADE